METTIKTPVLIVGGGPVGLSMAIELGWRGVDSILVDEGDGTIEHPRTGLVAVRTMELFRRWGLAQRVRECGFPEDYELSMVFCTSLNGLLLDAEKYPSMRDAPTPPETPERKQRCPQLWLQPILTEAARAQPRSKLLFKHRFNSLRQDDHGVTAEVTDLATGDPLTIRAEYLLGCDGATSNVREQVGIKMEGRLLSYSVNVLIHAPGLVGKHQMGQAERYLFVGPEGTWGNLTVVDGHEIWRLTVLGSEEKMNLATFDPAAWVRRAIGRDDVGFEVDSSIPWRRSEMLADHYFKGRVVLVGDSAHTMSPTGGMGMNTGAQEVLDIGWKLEGLINGWGGPALLRSYEVERRPVAQRNIDFSTQNFRAWQDTPSPKAVCDLTPEGEAARKALGQRLRESTRVEWESLGLQIGHRYENSPINVPDGTPPTPDDYSTYVPTTRPGSRAPHVWLKDGRSTLDLFGRQFVLVVFDTGLEGDANAFAKAFAAKGVPFRVEFIEQQDVAQTYERPLVLVRPDGHVAWRGSRAESPRKVVDTVRGAA
jgi:2-polyprenyl-6-methoxyphenol hydroxylase-like FAD-dependent oxidoreductase